MRIVSFFDGAESETTPTIGNIVASGLVQYANDAAYEANEQGAPSEGNIYFNTTSNLIRYYNGTSWINLVDETSTQTLENKEIDGSSTGNNTVLTVADNVEVTPGGNLASTNTQDALEELQGDINALDTRLDTAEADIIDLQTDKENKSEKGAANGYAPLDGASLIPSIHLPSYVDDVLEYANLASFPITGETGKIYVALDTNFQYRWSGSIYVQLAASPVNSVNGQTGLVVLDLDDINDVAAPSPSIGDVLTFDGADWINQAASGGSLDSLSDVTLTSPITGQTLVYNGSQWVNQTGVPTTLTTKTTAYAATVDDEIILVDATSASFTLTLFTAVGNSGKHLVIKKINSANIVTIDANSSETIDGLLTRVLNGQEESIVIFSDGSNWKIKSFYTNKYLTATSSVKTAAGANNYHAMTGNSVTLTPGKWQLAGSCTFLDNGSSPQYSFVGVGFFGANGADSSSQPTALISTANLTLDSNVFSGLQQSFTVPSSSSATLGLSTVFVTVTANVSVFVVPFSNQVTSANARITTYITAKRLD